MRFCQRTDFGGIVIGEEKLTPHTFAQGEQTLMIDFAVAIEAGAGALAAGGIGRVDEENRACLISMSIHDGKGIALNKLNTGRDMRDACDAFGDGLWIPPRKDAFAILTMLKYSGPLCKDAAMRGAILKNCLQGTIKR